MRNWYRSLPNWFKAGAATALFSFFTLFITSLIGFLNGIIEWANSEGTAGFPKLSTLGYAAASAAVAVVIGLVNMIYRFLQSRTALIPGIGPQYSGDADPAPSPE